MPYELLLAFCSEEGFPISEAQVEQFGSFESALYQANRLMNLTRVPRENCELRHFVDSLLIAKFLPIGSYVLDIGTGAGFPAWPLACARPDLRIVALDSSRKMLEFLRPLAPSNLKTMEGRAENQQWSETFDVVTGRALAPLPIQLEISASACKVGGFVIPFRTPAEQPEDAYRMNLGLEMVSVEKRTLPTTDVVRAFPIYEKVGSTEAGYPRAWASIKKKPL